MSDSSCFRVAVMELRVGRLTRVRKGVGCAVNRGWEKGGAVNTGEKGGGLCA